MDDTKICSRIKMVCLKTKFRKNRKSKDCLISRCKSCKKFFKKI